MRETTNKYQLPEHFYNAKLVCYPYDSIYCSHLFTFLLTYPPFQKFTYKVDLKRPIPEQFYRILLMTFIMSGHYQLVYLPG